MSTNYTYIEPDKGAPIKAWNKGVEFDANTIQQLRNIANLPFIHKHVAAMPDAHLGIGATVGSVIADQGRGDPGGGRRRHRLRHDGMADDAQRQ
jgi:tRNA-splicing ligase RtcB